MVSSPVPISRLPRFSSINSALESVAFSPEDFLAFKRKNLSLAAKSRKVELVVT
jgi:hypothetical protein